MTPRSIRRAAERKAVKLARKATQANPNPNPAIQPKPPTSDAQIAANRQNAQLSRGPITPEGKAIVSQNRTMHGLNSTIATFRVLPCESQPDYDHLLNTLLEEENPATTNEELLVIAMAQHRWLFNRATRLQETCLDPETAQVTDQKLFALYLRYATTHERAYHKCLNDLLKIRATKVKSDIGFDSERRLGERHESLLRLDEIELEHRKWQLHAARNVEKRALDKETYEQEFQKAA